MYENGLGTLKHIFRATKYYKKAVKNGEHPGAQLALIRILLRMLNGDLKQMVKSQSEEELLKGWGELAEMVYDLYENPKASSEQRNEASQIWDEHKLWKHPN